ncbi:MAG: ABC transporter permease [Treponema sp.]|jgi:ABC-type lipoprotein release transport system permease subunit|nr:ABC transporter permease [Treponema sp.]
MNWRLILRNITGNRKNSLVIFLLIALISALFFIGNSVMGQTNTALRKTYVESLTADVIIQKTGGMSMNLFGANSPVIDNYVGIPTLPAHDNIIELIAAEGAVESSTCQVSTRAVLELPDSGGGGEGIFLCGVDPETYFDCFPGIVVEEGRALESGEYGAMITASRADRIERETGRRPVPGAPLLFTSAGYLGFRIREVPLAGIYRYENPGQFMNEIVIADPQTARVLAAIQVATAPVENETAETYLPGDPSLLFDGPGTGVETYDGDGFDPDDLISILGASGDAETENAGGDWNFILLRLGKGVSPGRFIREFNKKLAPFNAHASGWRTAAGTSAIMMLLVQSFFNIGGFLVSAAGVIVVVNILLISVFRRTKEIGTLRAIGASDSYIRFLVMGENCFLAALAGITGVLGGMLFLFLINSFHVEIPNDLAASLLGGKILRVGFAPSVALVSFCVALLLGAAASVYPVETAVRIDPITAVRQG